MDVARHPFRWLLISLRSINRHRAPVFVAVAAAAAAATHDGHSAIKIVENAKSK
jgi:hypothetical protein